MDCTGSVRGEGCRQVGAPTPEGFNAVPVREFRGALVRTFENKGIDVGVNFSWVLKKSLRLAG